MENDLNTLALALYVTTDDYLNTHPELLPARPASGYQPRISDCELIVLGVMESLLRYTSERHFLRHAHTHLTGMFPHIPQQPGYNKRQRNLTGVIQHVMVHLATSTGLLDDDVWIVDSTPVECGRSRETVKRLRSGRNGRVRLLCVALEVLLGDAPAPGLHPAWDAGRLRGHRGESR